MQLSIPPQQPASSLRWLLLGSYLLIGLILLALAWPAALMLASQFVQHHTTIIRLTALLAYCCGWLATAAGMTLGIQQRTRAPRRKPTFQLHHIAAVLASLFAVAHLLALLSDHTLDYTLWNTLTPFAASTYRPWLAGLLGKLGFYLLLAIVLSYSLRAWLGPRTWRLAHRAGLALFPLLWLHGVLASPQPHAPWRIGFYWGSAGLLLLLGLLRAVIPPKTRLVAKP